MDSVNSHRRYHHNVEYRVEQLCAWLLYGKWRVSMKTLAVALDRQMLQFGPQVKPIFVRIGKALHTLTLKHTRAS